MEFRRVLFRSKIVGCTGNGAVHQAKILDVRAQNEINAGALFVHPGIRTLDNMVELAVDRVDIIARPAFQQVGIATVGLAASQHVVPSSTRTAGGSLRLDRKSVRGAVDGYAINIEN